MNIEQLILKCHMYRYEVTKGDHLFRPRNEKRPPMFITCIDSHTKWKFLREINKLRKTDDPQYESMYARPFMSTEDLKKDREVVRKLKDIRTKQPGKIFKIYKGEVYQEDGSNFLPYHDPEQTEPNNTEDPAQHTSENAPEHHADNADDDSSRPQETTEGTDTQKDNA